MLQIRPYYTF